MSIAANSFEPLFNTGTIVLSESTANSILNFGAGYKSISITNLSFNTVSYVKIGVGSITATTADFPILPGQQVILKKDSIAQTISYVTPSGGGRLEIIAGQGHSTSGLATYSLPVLDFPFAAQKNTNDIVSGSNLITFTRASTATFIGSDGLIQTAGSNVARFTHNPITLESLGLLIEEQRTNIFAQSEAFETWNIALATVTTNTATAPNGTSTADRINSTGGGVWLNSTIATGTSYTYSVFAKHFSGSGVVDLLGFENFGGVAANARISVNLLTGVIVSQQSNVTGATITAFPNGWYRITVTATSTATTGAITNYASLSGNQFLLWGAQLEVGAFATSYIPTVGASITRNADITDANYSSFAGTTEHTLYADFINLFSALSTTANVCELTDGINTYSRIFQTSASNALVSQNMFLGGVNQVRIDTANSYSNIQIKVASAFATNNRAIAVNGNASVTSAVGTVGTYTQLSIGHQLNLLQLNGTIRRLSYYPRRLSNIELQMITS